MSSFPVLMHTVLDATDCRGLAEFYRRLLGLRYRDGDEPATDGGPDAADWLVLIDDGGRRVLAVQESPTTRRPTWPSQEVPTQLHLDFRVSSVAALERHRGHAELLGARLLHDRSQDDDEPLYVLADPAGHPFCLLVGQGRRDGAVGDAGATGDAGAMAAESQHLGVVIERSAADVYAFAADPANLPRWAGGLASSTVEQVDGRWVADSPMGRVQVELAPRNDLGVLDHVVTLGSGERVLNPLRVIPHGGSSEVVFTLRRRPGTSEVDLARDADAVRADLATLRRILEDR